MVLKTPQRKFEEVTDVGPTTSASAALPQPSAGLAAAPRTPPGPAAVGCANEVSLVHFILSAFPLLCTSAKRCMAMTLQSIAACNAEFLPAVQGAPRAFGQRQHGAAIAAVAVKAATMVRRRLNSWRPIRDHTLFGTKHRLALCAVPCRKI